MWCLHMGSYYVRKFRIGKVIISVCIPSTSNLNLRYQHKFIEIKDVEIIKIRAKWMWFKERMI